MPLDWTGGRANGEVSLESYYECLSTCNIQLSLFALKDVCLEVETSFPP